MTPHQEASSLFERAYRLQMTGQLPEALDLYSRSIEIYPTAEAYTFRGWTYSFLGDFASAIEECLRAIALDPGYGNPYNDIGAYLIEQGELELAIPWLEKAAGAPRYSCQCFPAFNLGRVYERLHDYERAIRYYRSALELNPGYTLARQALARVCSQLN